METYEEDSSCCIEDAKAKFNRYAEAQKGFQAPHAHIDIETEPDETTRVHMEVQHNGIQYCFESIKEKDVADVYHYLNSQPLVREKFGDGNTLSLAATTARVNALVSRFRNKNSPLHLYSGFVVSDAQTETFLGIVNLGSGPEPGTSEIARLNRSEYWSHPPDVVSTYAIMDSNIMNRKTYSGIGTVETCTLLQYAARLKQEGYKVNYHPLTAVVATARVDNEGSWKSNAKAGMILCDVDVFSSYGSHLRYQLRKNIKIVQKFNVHRKIIQRELIDMGIHYRKKSALRYTEKQIEQVPTRARRLYRTLLNNDFELIMDDEKYFTLTNESMSNNRGFYTSDPSTMPSH
ncbi:unnamed protein product [Rotaria magnacalcarata]|uniref:Uncharacterized protein n=1 Tax=Rotaria magnacalcarata TaxID=392030 RepID=A0A816NJB7_9BILA|nr:unnamed protein product [Rotaria magnacalcarata]